MTNARMNAVKALIDLSVPLEKLSGCLNQFEWDYDGEPVELRSDHAVRVLTSYVNGALTAKEVETWADLVESREDISFDPKSEEWLRQAIYELANPLLTQPLDLARAKALIASAPAKEI
jgi:hypothetical protein